MAWPSRTVTDKDRLNLLGKKVEEENRELDRANPPPKSPREPVHAGLEKLSAYTLAPGWSWPTDKPHG